ncbi:metallophosphoesterase [Rhizobium helianthi]|uniref:Metallophosphoesterase n=1 Tax=Rhizobium helianthi TaxID=1132695 RepID=A0ABW4M5B6_9HYPH
MTDEPLLSFGVIADPQYADQDDDLAMNRYFRNSLNKLAEATATFESEDLSFIITLGDLIDRGWQNFEAPLEIYRRSRHEILFLAGNHDFLVEPEKVAEVRPRLGMPRGYYSFCRSGIRFLVVDGCEESLFAAGLDERIKASATERLDNLIEQGAINAKDWNAGMSQSQFVWIESELETARQKGQEVIVLGHYPLVPLTDHCLWDADVLSDLLARHAHVRAYLNGHDHRGGLGRQGDCWFVTFKGMVDTAQENAFAIVDVFADRLKIRGFGRELSRSLDR